MSRMIFVNLPVRDLDASTAFYVALSGKVNELFSDEQARSVMLSDTISVMLLPHDRYRHECACRCEQCGCDGRKDLSSCS